MSGTSAAERDAHRMAAAIHGKKGSAPRITDTTIHSCTSVGFSERGASPMSTASIHDLGIEPVDALLLDRPMRHKRGPLLRSDTSRSQPSRRTGGPLNRCGECIRVLIRRFRFDANAGVRCHHVSRTAPVRDDGGKSMSHGFEHDVPARLPEAREDEEIRVPVEAIDLISTHGTTEIATIRDSETTCLVPTHRDRGTASEEDRANPMIVDASHGPNKVERAFRPHHPADEQQFERRS